MITQATVQTPFGELYLKKLCRHFAHKVPAALTETQGRIEFPFGPCRIDVDIDTEQMRFSIDVREDHEVVQAEKVVKDHLLRMANRDQPLVEWHRLPTVQTSDSEQLGG